MSIRAAMTVHLVRVLSLGLALALVPGDTFLYATVPPAPPSAPVQSSTLTADQLENLAAPLALYPDPLLSQILVASTYPLQIVQAEQWLDRHPELRGQDLIRAGCIFVWRLERKSQRV